MRREDEDEARVREAASEPFLVHARYTAGAVLGRGAQGVVGRVVDIEAPERPLCAKVWRPGTFHEQALIGEFALLSRLRIPGVVRAHDLGRDERTGAPFLVEEYIDGQDAEAWIKAAPLEEKSERLSIVLGEAARALADLHDAGFVHSDLKPAHVRRRSERGEPPETFALLDLGAAVSRARSETAALALTPAFAAPEIQAGGAPSPASDLFGLGALACLIASGRSHRELCGWTGGATRHVRRSLRDFAPWLRPSVAELIEALIQHHPSDRPPDARDVLRRLGALASEAGAPRYARQPPPAPLGRERELAALLEAREAVLYVTGPSGSGKSHLVRELVTRSLLAGRSARLIIFPRDADPIVPRLIAFLRGADEQPPFVTPTAPTSRAPLLLVLDELERAPIELAAALDAFRCREARPAARLQVVAAARGAPAGASVVELSPLSDEGFADLCRALGVVGAPEAAESASASGKNPGWLVASLGRVPLTRDTALERVRDLSEEARSLLAAIAVAGGSLSEAICAGGLWGGAPPGDPRAWLGELLAASLITRTSARLDGGGSAVYALSAPALAGELASALATSEAVERASEALLRDAASSCAALFAAAGAPHPPRRREHLLESAAAKARSEGRRAIEIDALLALAAIPSRRTTDVLCRLERLTRDAGAGSRHPQVLLWLDDAASSDARARPLSLRRRAEKLAREGNTEGARSLAEEALAAARTLNDPAAEAFALATLGLVALFRASWGEASTFLSAARARAPSGPGADDAEELARLDHNAGVVALYRGEIDEAVATFERSLAVKRALGDRAGMRSCLMNLGIALGRASRIDEARSALDEARRLAISLGERAGLGWCLFARAEIEVERGAPSEATRWIAEAWSLAASLPAAIRADLVILRARVASLEGDGDRALAELLALDPAARAGDALLETRALLAEAGAHLARLPADPRRAARLAVQATRRARAATLGEMEVKAIKLLQRARSRGGPLRPTRPPRAAAEPTDPTFGADGYPSLVGRAIGDDDDLWAWLACAGAGEAPSSCALSLARLLVKRSGAERAIVAVLDPSDRVIDAWGADLDGLEVAQASERLDRELVRTAMRRSSPVYQRDVATAGGVGSRLAAASPEPSAAGSPRAAVVLEHRFFPGHFDAITADEVSRFAALAAIVARLYVDRRTAQVASVDVGAPRTALSRDDQAQAAADAMSLSAATSMVPLSGPRRSFPQILGESPALLRALARLDAAIDSELPALIVGETGAGKELFARALHELGPRRAKELVAINCGGIPEALFEAELFGHARGSFTGAERARPGLLARAEGGTLLLDELGELPLSGQAALLRALETRRYRPVGSDDERPFNVRIVAATNRDLEQAVVDRSFRQDLLYRLNAIEVRVPPLRRRDGDVALLFRSFLEQSGASFGLTPRALSALSSYAWPGNVRELLHLVQRLSVLGVADVDLEHLPRAIRASVRAGSSSSSGGVSAGRKVASAVASPRGEEDDARGAIRRALAETGGNLTHAAARLGITRHGLKKRMLRLGLRPAGASRT